MQIATLIELVHKQKLPPLQRKVLKYLEEHTDEVFEYRDQQLTGEVGGKPSSIGFSLWALHKRGLIDKEVVAGKVYFGSIEAVRQLRSRLGTEKGDPFERAFANANRIRERIGGNLNSLEILDELRSASELP